MYPIPVKRHQGQVCWCDRKVKLEDCKDICNYIDFCLHVRKEPDFPQQKRIEDVSLLLDLASELDGVIPWFTEDEKNLVKQGQPAVLTEPREPQVHGYRTGCASQNYEEILLQIKKINRHINLQNSRVLELETQLNQLTGMRDAYFKYIAEHNRWEKAVKRESERLDAYKSTDTLYRKIKDRWQRYHVNKKIIARQITALQAAMKNNHLLYERIHWNILPEGESLFPALRQRVNVVAAEHPQKRCDPQRLQKIERLKPEKAYFGSGEFDGYFVFLFSNSPYAILECPWVGNALYLLKGNWVELSKLSKQTLLSKHQDTSERIIHDANETWFRILEGKLRRSRT